MKARIDLITIWTDNIEEMKFFYNKILGFKVKNDLGEYIEFENEGVRFAICLRNVVKGYSEEFSKESRGQSFELAFPCEDSKDVDRTYEKLISMGATSIHKPKDMPWNQRTAMFSDPDGNIHEIFSDFKKD